MARLDTRNCLMCHPSGANVNQGTSRNRAKPMFAGLSGEMNPAGADWSYVDRLRKMTKMKVMLKGIDTAEDAALAREHGVDGVVLSNHGGRAHTTRRRSPYSLAAALAAVLT